MFGESMVELWRNYGGKHCRVIEGNQVVNVARKLAFLKPLYSLFHAMTLVRHTPISRGELLVVNFGGKAAQGLQLGKGQP